MFKRLTLDYGGLLRHFDASIQKPFKEPPSSRKRSTTLYQNKSTSLRNTVSSLSAGSCLSRKTSVTSITGATMEPNHCAAGCASVVVANATRVTGGYETLPRVAAWARISPQALLRLSYQNTSEVWIQNKDLLPGRPSGFSIHTSPPTVWEQQM